ncbi:MAG: dual specificity protein phosphatase family protein [Phenylobacterium sp.]
MAITKIRDNLFLSGSRDINDSVIEKYGITAILNVADNARTPATKFAKKYSCPFADTTLAAAERSSIATDLAEELVNNGHIILIHCMAGSSRSPHIMALLISRLENRKYAEVYDEIYTLRPCVMKQSLQDAIDAESWWKVLKNKQGDSR